MARKKPKTIEPATALAVAGLLTPAANPLTSDGDAKSVDLEQLASPVIIRRPARRHMRELRDLRRRQNAAAAIEGLDRKTQIFGFTKGQFSLLELIRATLDAIGPAFVSLSTWTASKNEIDALRELKDSGRMLGMRWLVDFTFAKRDRQATTAIRSLFGVECIRVAQNHAKFATFKNDTWELVLLTSMNLNMNTRFEDFTIAHDPELFQFLEGILNEIWRQQKRSLADATMSDIRRFFANEM